MRHRDVILVGSREGPFNELVVMVDDQLGWTEALTAVRAAA